CEERHESAGAELQSRIQLMPPALTVSRHEQGGVDASAGPAIAPGSPGAEATTVATGRAFRGDPSALTGSVRRRPSAHHPPVFLHAALENRRCNCLSRSRYRRSQARRLASITKSSQSSPVESTGIVFKD